MSIAFMFPGQGSQSVGMLSALATDSPSVRSVFDEASGVLGYDLWQLVQSGPAEKLNATECTQPAMLVAGIATLRVWQERGGATPALVTGHSLGEFTALVCAEVLQFSAAVDLVRYRGKVMQEAVPAGSGAMAAILGIDEAEVEAACREASASGIVEAVNFNAPGQVVIAGESAAVERAIELAKARGAKRAMKLAVSVPAHSSLMSEAARKFGEYLSSVELRAPRIKYISAVDSKAHSDIDDIRALLVRQLASPVRWHNTVRALVGAGARHLIECGPGKVLAGLNRRIDGIDGAQTHALEDFAALDAAIAATKGTA